MDSALKLMELALKLMDFVLMQRRHPALLLYLLQPPGNHIVLRIAIEMAAFFLQFSIENAERMEISPVHDGFLLKNG